MAASKNTYQNKTTMRHPFEFCATRYCCCFDLDADLTCYIIAIICILFNGFSGLTNIGVTEWFITLFSIINILLYIIAGTLLFLGTYWDRDLLKIIYCWMVFIAIFTVLTAMILYLVFRKDVFVIWTNKCHGFNSTLGSVILLCNLFWLLFWNIYTPMVVMGNLNCEEECCDETAIEL